MKGARLLFVLPVIASFAACSPPGNANTARVVSGTITLPFAAEWASIKLGVFSGGTLGTYPKLGYYSTSDVSNNRIIYNDKNDGSIVVIPPVSGSSFSISSTSGTSSSYTFELPSQVPQSTSSGDEFYYYGLWYDAGTTPGSLDLKDASGILNTAVAQQGEFNRMATKVAQDSNLMVVTYFGQSKNLSTGAPTGNYKYYANNGISDNEYNEIKDFSSGFNFTVSSSSGW